MNDPLPRTLRIGLILALGAWLGTALPAALGALSSPDAPLMWWSARAVGLVAQLALWMSMLFGVFVGAKGAGGLVETPWTRELHLRWSLAAIGLVVLHVVLVVVDPHAGVGPWAAFVPLASPIRSRGIALGTVAMLALAGVHGATVVMRRLPPGVWRAVHATSFGVFLLASLHTLSAGTDADLPVVRGLLGGMVAVLVGAIVQRVLVARAPVARA